MNRRDFLAQTSLALAAATIPNKIAAAINPALKGTEPMSQPIAAKPSPSHDLDFASALQAAEAIRKKQISSLELTERMFARIDRYNPQLNAFVYQLREDAIAQAKKADEAQAGGKSLGVFHGVPFNVKESFGVAGYPDTWGIPFFKDSSKMTGKVMGGWQISGQKVWTSGAHLAGFGLVTVRTNPDAPKHQGITTMVIDMHAPGVTVRPLKMPTGHSDFNEVFFDDVFVPDADVVGPIDGGWTVARATLGNESVSIGSGDGGMALPGSAFIAPFDAHPERLTGGASRVGRQIARIQAMGALNLRSAYRAVAGGGPGPEGNVAKLLLAELGHEAAAILAELAGPDGAFLEGDGAMAATLVLMNRAMSIAGGTSEIKRNQIAERILGLPRDPLIK